MSHCEMNAVLFSESFIANLDFSYHLHVQTRNVLGYYNL